MKYKDLIQLTTDDDGRPLTSLEKAQVVRLTELDEYQQVLVLHEESGIKYRILIKPDNLRLTEDDIGSYISFKGTPPDSKGISKGISFVIVDDKPRVVITKSATMKLSSDSDEPAEVVAVEKVEQKAEVVEADVVTNPRGPSDNAIVESFLERLYILEIIERENEKMGNPFTREALMPMVTSIYIDAQRTNNKILPKGKWTPKQRFGNIEKPHQLEAQASAKKAEESLLKGADMAMVEALKNETESRFREVIKLTGLSDAVDVKGAALDWCSVNRPVLIRWLFMKKDKTLSKRVKPTYDSINKFFFSLPNDLKYHVAIEAMIYNEIEKNDQEYNPDFFYDSAITEWVGQQIAPFFSGVEHSNMVAVALNYFSNQPKP